MGLRTASVRRSYAVVMAPALTETTQSQNFKLPPKSPFQPASPISYEPNKYHLTAGAAYFKGNDAQIDSFNVSDKKNFDKNDVNSVFIKEISDKDLLKDATKASDNFKITMNSSPRSMGDQNEKMGLQKTGIESVSSLHKDKIVANDVDQLLNNFSSVLPGDCTTGDIPSNVDDIMQVIRSMETGSDRLGAVPGDLNDVDFGISGAEIANNLSSFEKQLINDVAMMNMSMEDQIETVDNLKETRSKELIAELHKKQAKVQRRLDFLKRRVHKLQSRLMGQHISGEVAGVFEQVFRSLRKLKENSSLDVSRSLEDTSSISTTTQLTTDSTPEKLKPITYGCAKTLVRKLETSAVMQANAVAKHKFIPRYFGSGSVEPTTYRTGVTGVLVIPPWLSEHKSELQKVSGLLQAELGIVQHEVDSEATESSSGGESCDEFQNYNNQHQQYLSIQKRALWKYATERAQIAARWTWLQSQISDLEYRIRQHTDLHRKIRSSKEAVLLGGPNPQYSVPSSPTAVNGYRGQLPGNSSLPKSTDGESTHSAEYPHCARTRPLSSFKKRKLVQVNGLHAISKKAARPSTIRCGCVSPSVPCALCTGRTDPMHPRDPPETLSKMERVALLDPGFHPVFSLSDDVSESLHFEAIMKMPEWQQRSTRMKSLKGYSKGERLDKTTLDHRVKKLDHRKKYGRLLKPSTMSALSAKIKNKIRGRKANRHALNRFHQKRHSATMALTQFQTLSADGADEEVESIDNNANKASLSVGASPSVSPLLHMQSTSGYNRKNRVNSYDIDNIVIPYSVAASTRVERLQYKEILTPKWRIADPDFATRYTKNNGEFKETSQDSDPEDLSETAVISRHDKCEHEERKKFLSYLKLPAGYGRTRSHKRTDSRAESSGANTPDPMSPHPADNQDNTNSPITSPPATPLSMHIEDSTPLPSISAMRRRTISQSRFAKDREPVKEENRCNTPESEEIVPFDRRTFPLTEETYDKMLKHMPEDHLKTNSRSQDFMDLSGSLGFFDDKMGSPGSESTESALAEEDPNDPEWIEVERSRDRKR